MFVGIDFGTSNSSIGLYRDEKLQLFELDPGHINPNVLPSFIYASKELDFSVGVKAIQNYLDQETGRRPVWAKQDLGSIKITVAGAGKGPITYDQPILVDVDVAANGRLLQSIKTALRSSNYEGTQIFGRFFSIEELIAILLTRLRETCEGSIGQRVERAVIGRPVKFSDNLETDQRAQQKIHEAARLAGFKEIVFELEPIGGAYLYHQSQSSMHNVLVFDFGGGTLDMTIAEVGGSRRPKVIANQGVLLGGDDLTCLLMKNMLRYFGAGAVLPDGFPFPAHILEMLFSWQNMVELSKPHYAKIIEQAKHGSDPLGIQRLDALVNKKLGFNLFQELERVKIGLSSSYFMPLNFLDGDLRMNDTMLRTRYEQLIQEEVNLVNAAIDELMAKSGLKPDQIHAVLRTGGSSEIPVFIETLGRHFGADRIKEINPFTTIVGGLALRGHELSKSRPA